jgi:two-component system, OmpR family, response regulator
MMLTRQPRRILIIDDDLDTVGMLRLVMQRRGYEVGTATHWEEIADRLRLADAEKRPFELIILDVMMPERSGFDIYNSLMVAMHPMPPVIFLSAKSSIETMVQAQEIGAAKYLVKPTTPDKLIAAVESVLQQQPPRRLS